MKLLEKVKTGLKKFKEDLEKESVSHGDHRPHCCTLPEDMPHTEAEFHKGMGSGKIKRAA